MIMVYHLTNVVWLGPHRVIFCRPYQKVVARKKLIFQRKFSWHVETAQKEELISTKGSTTTQFMKKYILRNINHCDNGLPLKNVVWCGPHRAIFRRPYQKIVAQNISTGNLTRMLILLERSN